RRPAQRAHGHPGRSGRREARRRLPEPHAPPVRLRPRPARRARPRPGQRVATPRTGPDLRRRGPLPRLVHPRTAPHRRRRRRPPAAGAPPRVLGRAHTCVARSAAHRPRRTHVTTGRLDAARRTLRRTALHLDATRGPDGGEVPVVVVEPSCASTLREDLPRLLAGTPNADAARRVAARIRSAAEHLGRLAAEGRAPAWPGGAAPDRVTVQTHCHEYATFSNRVQRATLTALGVGSVREATGCCGVAGDFGFTAGHEVVTAAVAEQALAPA